MAQMIRHCVWVILASGIVFFLNLGVPQLWDEDEPKNAACAREMLERHDWVVPMFNYELRTAKPVLVYWFMMTAYEMFGVSEFGARFWSAILGIGTCLLTYGMGRRLFHPTVGLWAALMLAAALMFGVASRAATPDAPLIFFSTLSLAIFVWGLPQSALAQRLNGAPQTATGLATGSPYAALRKHLPQSWWTYIGVYTAMAIAVLAKGPVGVALPTLILMGYLWAVELMTRPTPALFSVSSTLGSAALWQRCRYVVKNLSPVAIWRVGWVLRPLTAIVLVAAIALPWYVWVSWRTDGAWIAGFLGKHNVTRFMQPLEGHSGPVFYYVIAVMIGFFPWSIFLPLACLRLIQRLRAAQSWTAGDLFCCSWATIYIGFFSLASTKLPSYVLPAYPALALITARWATEWLAAPQTTSPMLRRCGFLNLSVFGLLFLVGVPLATARLLPGTWYLGWAGLIPLVGGLVAYLYGERQQFVRAAQAFGAASLVFTACLFGIVAVQVNPHQTSAALMSHIFNQSPRPQIAAFDYFEPSLAYYAGQPVQRIKTPEQAVAFLQDVPGGCLIIRDKYLTIFHEALGQNLQVLDRRRRFLKADDILVLTADRKSPVQVGGPHSPDVRPPADGPANRTAAATDATPRR